MAFSQSAARVRATKDYHGRLRDLLGLAAVRARDELGVALRGSDIDNAADLIRCLGTDELIGITRDRLAVERTP